MIPPRTDPHDSGRTMTITHITTRDGDTYFPARGYPLDVEGWDTGKFYIRLFARTVDDRRQLCWVILYWNDGWVPVTMWGIGG